MNYLEMLSGLKGIDVLLLIAITLSFPILVGVIVASMIKGEAKRAEMRRNREFRRQRQINRW